MTTASIPVLTKKDFQTDQEVRWCPGCGDYAILSAVQAVFPELGIPREKFVVISGIGHRPSRAASLPFWITTALVFPSIMNTGAAGPPTSSTTPANM